MIFMLSRRSTLYNFDYTVVLHMNPSAIKTCVSLTVLNYSRMLFICQEFNEIFCRFLIFFLFQPVFLILHLFFENFQQLFPVQQTNTVISRLQISALPTSGKSRIFALTHFSPVLYLAHHQEITRHENQIRTKPGQNLRVKEIGRASCRERV